MSSLRYNTFNNEEIVIIQPLSSSLVTCTTENQCLICLQNSSNPKDEIKSINEMHFLKKTCNCICYSHHKCIETWIETNAVCPICKKPLLFPETKSKSIKNETALDISINSDETRIDNSCKSSAFIYIWIMVAGFTIIFLGNLIITTQP
jgi:hypothetical protein